ncbi:hypothetical protein EON62_04930 [archaeon]|nr:MAG: hypothetical protein EON62_04930 [archaeon]
MQAMYTLQESIDAVPQLSREVRNATEAYAVSEQMNKMGTWRNQHLSHEVRARPACSAPRTRCSAHTLPVSASHSGFVWWLPWRVQVRGPLNGMRNIAAEMGATVEELLTMLPTAQADIMDPELTSTLLRLAKVARHRLASLRPLLSDIDNFADKGLRLVQDALVMFLGLIMLTSSWGIWN